MIGMLLELQQDYAMIFDCCGANFDYGGFKTQLTKKGDLFILVDIKQYDAILYSQIYQDYARWPLNAVLDSSEFFKEI